MSATNFPRRKPVATNNPRRVVPDLIRISLKKFSGLGIRACYMKNFS